MQTRYSGPWPFSSFTHTDDSTRRECWEIRGLPLPPFLHPPNPPSSSAPGRGQRMEPIIFLNVPSLFLPISHLDWIQIPWFPVSPQKVPNVNSKLTLFMLFCFSISTPNPLPKFSYCLKMSCNELCLFKTPHLAILVYLPSLRQTVHMNMWRGFVGNRE